MSDCHVVDLNLKELYFLTEHKQTTGLTSLPFSKPRVGCRVCLSSKVRSGCSGVSGPGQHVPGDPGVCPSAALELRLFHGPPTSCCGLCGPRSGSDPAALQQRPEESSDLHRRPEPGGTVRVSGLYRYCYYKYYNKLHRYCTGVRERERES